jgi:two-component system, OmpR family, response regulator
VDSDARRGADVEVGVANLATPVGVQHPRVLVVDDDADVVNLLSTSLTFQGFEVDTATSGPTALDRARELRPDAVLLEVTLPGIDGFGVLRRLRTDRIQTPVLFLTARDTLHDRITGLTLGADDYITKPFSLEEVIARLRAILRRTGTGAHKPHLARLVFADIELDEDTREVSRAGVPVSLSPREFALLRYFVINAGAVLSKQRILEHVWSHNFAANANCVECYISSLRHKIDTDQDKRLLHTLRGVGYVLREPRPRDQRSFRVGAARSA